MFQSMLIVGIGGIIIYLLYKFLKDNNNLEYEKIKLLNLEKILFWYKKPENKKLLESNNNLIRILCKNNKALEFLNDKQKKYNNVCLVLIYDKKKNNIIKGKVIEYETMEEELLKQFGNKDMIIFE